MKKNEKPLLGVNTGEATTIAQHKKVSTTENGEIDKVLDNIEDNTGVKTEQKPLSKSALARQMKQLKQFQQTVHFSGKGRTGRQYHPEKTQGRNELCACNSGKKFKKCCMNKVEEPKVVPRNPEQEDPNFPSD